MKGLFRLVAVVILLSALAGSVLLVERNQETRKGAAANETSSSILPDTVKVEAGKNFSVHVWLDTGKDTDKLTGAEFRVDYAGSKIKFVSLEPQTGFTLVNSPTSVEMTDNNGNNYLDIRLITMDTEKGGAISVIKLNFKALTNGNGSLVVSKAKVMIVGQTAMWEVSKNNPSSYTIGGGVSQKCYWCGDKCINSTTRGSCINIAPPAGKLCETNNDGSCTIKDITAKPVGCGQRCYSDTGCTKGMICPPIWWPCPTMADNLKIKLQNNTPLTKAEAEAMVKQCPAAKKYIPAGPATAVVVMPNFYGVCRTKTCLNSLDCLCGIVPSGTVTPTLKLTPTLTPKPTPTSIPGSVDLSQKPIIMPSGMLDYFNTMAMDDDGIVFLENSLLDNATNHLNQIALVKKGKIFQNFASWQTARDNLEILRGKIDGISYDLEKWDKSKNEWADISTASREMENLAESYDLIFQGHLSYQLADNNNTDPLSVEHMAQYADTYSITNYPCLETMTVAQCVDLTKKSVERAKAGNPNIKISITVSMEKNIALETMHEYLKECSPFMDEIAVFLFTNNAESVQRLKDLVTLLRP